MIIFKAKWFIRDYRTDEGIVTSKMTRRDAIEFAELILGHRDFGICPETVGTGTTKD